MTMEVGKLCVLGEEEGEKSGKIWEYLLLRLSRSSLRMVLVVGRGEKDNAAAANACFFLL